jgi:hypothetical protein
MDCRGFFRAGVGQTPQKQLTSETMPGLRGIDRDKSCSIRELASFCYTYCRAVASAFPYQGISQPQASDPALGFLAFGFLALEFLGFFCKFQGMFVFLATLSGNLIDFMHNSRCIRSLLTLCL